MSAAPVSQGLDITRRGLLAAGGAFVLFFDPFARSGAQTPQLPGSLATNRRLDAWLRINADGTVTLMTGKVELGQGVLTALGQICAEELDVALARVRIVSGDTGAAGAPGATPNEGTTAGSQSMQYGGTAVQYAAAEMRAILLGLAAQQLGVDIGTLSVSDGTVTAASGSSTTYWALLGGRTVEREASASVRPKDPATYRIVGTATPRLDFPAKMSGRPAYVQDIRLEGMVHARVVRPPRYGATLASVDEAATAAEAAVAARPGVVKVVRDGSFLAAIATREEQAIAAAASLREQARWEGGTALPGEDGIYDWLLAQQPKDIAVKAQARGDDRAVARTIEQTYRRPYHIHGSIGPSAAVAVLRDGTLTVHTHSQSVFETRLAIARMVGLPLERVRLQHMAGSGCYGHNAADDAAGDAAALAMALPGRPVRVQWMREDEHTWEPFGSAMVLKLKAGLGPDGAVLDWEHALWSCSHGTRPDGQPGNLLAGQYSAAAHRQPVPVNGGPPNYAADRNAIPLYAFPGQRITTHFIETMPVRVSALRGLGAYANVFALESFIDELAHATGSDPVAYRLRHMTDARARAVIELAAERFGWSGFQRAAAGSAARGRGIAFARYKNLGAFTAVAVEVQVDRASGAVRVLRAIAGNDSGQIVNRDGIANQIEGGIIQSTSWTLKERVRFDRERILSRDWNDYPILTFSEVPEIEVHQIDRPGQPFLGTGESAQGPTGAAIANAVFDAVGARVRDLPLTPEHVKAAM